ncbi:MAG TPA: hypothetical protein VJ955_07610 [Desulfuromonadales bacterium]|nr:hypothetical protein [Desulfuromonadales bacterium]
MNSYEVVYDVEGEVLSAWVEAETPVAAQMTFLEEHAGQKAVVLAVVRQ